jgi:hypothetical protein
MRESGRERKGSVALRSSVTPHLAFFFILCLHHSISCSPTAYLSSEWQYEDKTSSIEGHRTIVYAYALSASPPGH